MRPFLSWPWWPIAAITYIAWAPATIITDLLFPPEPPGARIGVVHNVYAYAPMSPFHSLVDEITDVSLWPVSLTLWTLAWLAPRRPSARAQLAIGVAGFSATVAELALTETDTILDHLRSGSPLPLPHEYDLAGLVWFYGPPLLVMVATWSGLHKAGGVAGLPLPYRPARRTRIAIATIMVLVLATGEATPPQTEQPAPIIAPMPVPMPVPMPTPTPTPTPTAQTAEPELEGLGCRPRPRRPVIRPPGRRVTARVNAVWDRLDRWLARNAPRTYRELNPPARPKEIAAAEARIGVRLPGDLKASLLRHDGAELGRGSFFFVYRLTPIKEIVRDWKISCEVAEDWMPPGAKEPEGYVDPEGFWWHGSVVPFAMDLGGDSLVLDGKGRVGRFFNEEGLSFKGDWAWPSYADFLEDVADALEKGRAMSGWAPVVTREGDLEWD